MSPEIAISKDWIKPTSDGFIVVSPRNYEVVVKKLRLDLDCFHPGMRVLEIGGGLSNFSDQLHLRTGVKVWSVDPIYQLGRMLFHTDPKEIAKLLEDSYGGLVEFRNFQDIESITNDTIPVSLPTPDHLVAASAYDLPFDNNSFDFVLGHRVFEHLNFQLALPELLRVLKPGAEIRMSGLRLNIISDDQLIFTHDLEAVNNSQFYWEPHLGLADTLQDIVNNPNISGYVLPDKYPSIKISRKYPEMILSTLLIIRNDDRLPVANPLERENNEFDNPFRDKIMKIFPISNSTSNWQSYGVKAYHLSSP